MEGSVYHVDVKRFADKVRKRHEVVLRKIALDMFRRIILRSPVDTGRFRGNWQVAIGSVPDGVLEVNDKSGRATISATSAAIAEVKAGDTIYFVNNLPYARRLEYGWSDQAPNGMVRVTIEEFRDVVDKVVSAR
jgi:hypothetical protein